MKKALAVLASLAIVVALGFEFLAPGALYDMNIKGTRMAAGLKEHRIELGDYEYHYLDNEKTQKPLIVMVHGFTADKDNWGRMALFMRDYHIIALDLLGHGDSSRPADGDYTIEAQVARVKAFADALDLPKFHLIGNSMGGWISGVYAAKHSDDLLSVTLLDNAGVEQPNPSDMMQRLQAGESIPLVMDGPDDADLFFEFAFEEPPFMTPGVKKAYAERSAQHAELYRYIHDQFTSENNPMLTPMLSQIDVPVQIIWGDKDRILDVSSIDVMTPELEGETVVIMENCGHVPMLERPKETADHLDAFIQSLDS
ncbi:lipase 3, putative [gamma proteobacterium HTCC5015]|nr:lipase 3, putative [gamma proteobacterium HTCC5015]